MSRSLSDQQQKAMELDVPNVEQTSFSSVFILEGEHLANCLLPFVAFVDVKFSSGCCV